MLKNWLLLVLVAVSLFAVDQTLKSTVRPVFLDAGGEPGSIRIGYTQRPAPRSPWLPTAVWFLILGRLIVRAPKSTLAERVAFAVVLGGGLATLWDRWRYAAVRSPFTVILSERQVLPFGISDLAISLGGMVLCVLLAQEIVTRPKRRKLAHSF